MKFFNLDKACSLAEEREDLLCLRSAAVTNTVTIAAGTTPIAINSSIACELIDSLLFRNEQDLKELGVTDVKPWRLGERPIGPGGPKE